MTSDPTDFCEEFLRREIAFNTEQGILERESVVAERLLVRQLEMRPVYAELHRKLFPNDRAIRSFLGAVLSASSWQPEAIGEARASRTRLKNLNAEIAQAADALAKLLTQREKLHQNAAFYSNTMYHPLQLIDRAGEDNCLFRSWVRRELNTLRTYGLKYWPTVRDCIAVIACDAREANIEATDVITEAATSANRKGLADYLKAIWAAIEIRREGFPLLIPLDFTLSDGSFATLINCSLDLDPDSGVGADFVKGSRQRERARKSSSV